MKNSIVLKFLALVLCACCLLLSVASAGGIVFLLELGLYGHTVEQLQEQQMEHLLENKARSLAAHYAAANLSNCPEEFLDNYYHDWSPFQPDDEALWYYTLQDETGQILETSYAGQDETKATAHEYLLMPSYPVVISDSAWEAEGPTYFAEPAVSTLPTEETLAPEQGDYLWTESVGWEDEDGIMHGYYLGICQGPAYLVTVYTLPGAYTQESSQEWELLHIAYGYRYTLFAVLGVSLVLFAVLMVYLCCAAGRRPHSDEVRPGGLNAMPLDLYAALLGTAIALLAVGAVGLADFYYDEATLLPVAMLMGAMAYASCLLIVAFLFACAAQFKMRGLYWLRRSLVGMAVLLCLRAAKHLWTWVKRLWQWLRGKVPPSVKNLWTNVRKFVGALLVLCGKALSWCWKTVCRICKAIWSGVCRCFRWAGRGARRFMSLLPLTWQWLLTAFVECIILVVSIASRNEVAMVVAVCLCTAVVLYGTHAFGTLLEATRRMSKGDLDTKVDDRLLIGGFSDYAQHLNALAGVAVVAAQKQMKSERMKAELITNVSHDIKTPLTSIINYVDLLQKAETREEAQEYLDVLSRQSQRLKKLIEDLMEMSKASTGNIAVEILRTDASEAVTQALGEFSDKLAAARLTPVFNPPTEPVPMLADGRLTWRVLSNLLGNAVKYAMPGTRLYVDIVKQGGSVLISLKNISSDPLNVNSEELMERFVRGDESRNTEGSGLGLNIAQSLMELQKGQLQLLIDGDLFKATMVFPAANSLTIEN